MRAKNVFYLILLLLLSQSIIAQNARTVDSLITVLKATPTDTIQISALINLASEYRNNNPDKALEYVNKSLTKSQKINFQSGISRSMLVLGMINMSQSNYEKALSYFYQSLKLSRELNDRNTVSTSSNNIGMVYWNQGKYDKALEYFLISLKIDEELGNQNGVASSYNNIGLIYWSQNNYAKALENFNKVLQIDSGLKDKKGMATAYSNIGGVNYYMGMKDIAIMYFKKSLDLYAQINFRPGMSSTCLNISDVLLEDKKYDEALIYTTRAYNIEKEIGNKSQMCYVLISIAKNYASRNLYDKALENFREAVTISKEISALKQLSAAYLGTAEVYQSMNKYKDAYEFHQKYTEIKDSILNKESSSQIAEMNTKYSTDKKNKEIELLRKEKEIESIKRIAETNESSFIRNSLIVGCVFILLIALLLYNRNKVKQKANTELAIKNENINEQKAQIERKNSELAIKNKEITDSITYAKRLQEAILPPVNLIKRVIPNSFILYKPKDIVSGDFYFVEEYGNKAFIAAVDCTGHGVPGAFMSVVGYNLLNQALNVYGLSKPALILNDLNKNISKMLHQTEDGASVKDGMDICLISINYSEKLLEYAGAFNSLWIVRDNELIVLKADKFPVGAFVGEEIQRFYNHEFSIRENDMLYLFTDGYADQFGGEKGKKFKYKQLQELLIQNSHLPVAEQHQVFDTIFKNWKADLEQVDDVLLIGIKIS